SLPPRAGRPLLHGRIGGHGLVEPRLLIIAPPVTYVLRDVVNVSVSVRLEECRACRREPYAAFLEPGSDRAPDAGRDLFAEWFRWWRVTLRVRHRAENKLRSHQRPRASDPGCRVRLHISLAGERSTVRS